MTTLHQRLVTYLIDHEYPHGDVDKMATAIIGMVSESKMDPHYVEELQAAHERLRLAFQKVSSGEELKEFESIANKVAIERQHEMEKAQAELLEMTRKCAEMREALEFVSCHEHFDKPGSFPGTFCANSCEVCNRIEHALSSNCGKGWIRVSELEMTVEFLKGLRQLTEEFLDDETGHYSKATDAEIARIEALAGAVK